MEDSSLIFFTKFFNFDVTFYTGGKKECNLYMRNDVEIFRGVKIVSSIMISKDLIYKNNR